LKDYIINLPTSFTSLVEYMRELKINITDASNPLDASKSSKVNPL